MAKAESWFVYMVRCNDDTLYTGITTDPVRRIAEHNGEVGTAGKGAKYTAVRRPVKLVYKKRCHDRSEAASKEAALKQLSRLEKLKLILE